MADGHENREPDWAPLVESMRAGKCIVMLGPDAVRVRYREKLATVPVNLTKFLRRRVEQEKPWLDANVRRVTALAEAIDAACGRDTLCGWVEEFYDEVTLDDPALAHLAALEIPLLINAIPGLPVHRALPGGRSDHYHRAGSTRLVDRIGDRSSPLVYHLYGSLEEPASLVLTDRDLLDVLVAVIREEPPVPENLTSLFREPDRTFLFLGFQLGHWQLRVLMHVLDSASQRSLQSLAVETRMPNLDGDAPAFYSRDLDKGTQRFYQSDHRIDFATTEVDTFLSELAGRVASSPTQTATPAPRVANARPVFISYVREDEAEAMKLSKRLEDAGIDTWIDREGIRGGEKWDDKITRTLRYDAGHVIVLQSPNMTERRDNPPSYVSSEIDIAREINRQYSGSTRMFLVPVVIGNKEQSMQKDLLEYNTCFDLTDDDDVDQLIMQIRRDIQREQKR